MPTVDLPANNVYEISAGPDTTIVGGPSCLSATDTGTYVKLDGSGFVGGSFAVGATGVGTGGGLALGFGVFTLPSGGSLVGADFVAYGYRTTGHNVSEPTKSTGASGFYSIPVDKSPGLTAFYSGHAYHEALADFPLGTPAEVTTPVQRTDLVLDTGGLGPNGLGPEFDWDPFDAPETATIYLYYLAIRVTYTEPAVTGTPSSRNAIAPLRQHPRTDGLGLSTAPRLWPPSRSIQSSNRRAGGYL